MTIVVNVMGRPFLTEERHQVECHEHIPDGPWTTDGYFGTRLHESFRVSSVIHATAQAGDSIFPLVIATPNLVSGKQCPSQGLVHLTQVLVAPGDKTERLICVFVRLSPERCL